MTTEEEARTTARAAHEPLPWERQPDESSFWYNRFHNFLVMGPDRTLLGVYNQWKIAKGDKPTKCPAKSWRDACDRFNWRERANAWDAFMRDEERRLAETGRIKAAIKLGQAAPDAADALITVMQEKSPDHMGQRRLAASSILDRADETAARQTQGLTDEMRLALRKIGALALRYVPADKRDEFERDLEELVT